MVRTTDLTQRLRPVGVTLIAVLGLVSGILIAGRRVLMLADVYLEPGASVSFSWEFKVAVFGEMALSLIAIVSGVGLLIGAKWGWWLGAIHWAWRISRQALLLGLAILNRPLDANSGQESEISRLTGPLVIEVLILLYMFRANIFEYFGIAPGSKLWALVAVIGVGLILTFVLHALRTAVH